MDNQYSEKDISLDLMFNYVFKKLAPQQEETFESFLDEHEEYANLVDGILNYSIHENISSKEELEKRLDVDKTAFFKKFPDLVKYDKDNSISTKKENGQNWNKYFLLILFLLGAFSIWKMTNTEPVKEAIKEDTTIDASVIKEEEKKESIKNEKSDIEENKETLKKSDIQKNAIDTDKIPEPLDQKIERPKVFAEVKSELEQLSPIRSLAANTWENKFTVKGNNAVIEQVELLLTQGDSTQKSLYCIGLHELTKTPPNLNRAIKLLRKVKQNEYPDATWFLFRAYILNDNLQSAKTEFQKMKSAPSRNQRYYEDNFLKSLPPAIKDFFKVE